MYQVLYKYLLHLFAHQRHDIVTTTLLLDLDGGCQTVHVASTPMQTGSDEDGISAYLWYSRVQYYGNNGVVLS